ncbi:hypothetical protein [Cellulomonas sp. NS3]|uniref:hypothetical protein n=1 Tax=Cellulomonas sp. NS3 TaxID=2973977 RepID=UPI0021618049|nr:hypothetical protein [Cellulomonas sp. NS3]
MLDYALRQNLFFSTVFALARASPSSMAAVAPAHSIGRGQPGTAYVVDDEGMVDRVRADYWTDDAVRAVAQLHPAPPRPDL